MVGLPVLVLKRVTPLAVPADPAADLRSAPLPAPASLVSAPALQLMLAAVVVVAVVDEVLLGVLVHGAGVAGEVDVAHGGVDGAGRADGGLLVHGGLVADGALAVVLGLEAGAVEDVGEVAVDDEVVVAEELFGGGVDDEEAGLVGHGLDAGDDLLVVLVVDVHAVHLEMTRKLNRKYRGA